MYIYIYIIYVAVLIAIGIDSEVKYIVTALMLLSTVFKITVSIA